MAYNAKKTEHAGPKKGAGAYYGPQKLRQEGQQSPPPRKQQARDLNPWHITSVNVRRTAGPVVFSANHGK
jgi:hypothetical protein